MERIIGIFAASLLNNRYRLFLIWIRSISIITLILQVQTFISISAYALKLHKRRKLLLNEIHITSNSFLSTIKRCKNRQKSFLTSEKRIKHGFKKLKEMNYVTGQPKMMTM